MQTRLKTPPETYSMKVKVRTSSEQLFMISFTTTIVEASSERGRNVKIVRKQCFLLRSIPVIYHAIAQHDEFREFDT